MQMEMRKQRKERKKRRCSPRFMGSFARSSCVKIIWRQAEGTGREKGEELGTGRSQPSCLRQPQRRVYLKIMLHYLWPRRLRRQQKESVCIRRTKKLLLHVGGAGCRGVEWGCLVGFSIFVSVHFHIFTVCGMRQPHEAKTINCNKLRPTPCKERAQGERGEGGMEVGMQ